MYKRGTVIVLGLLLAIAAVRASVQAQDSAYRLSDKEVEKLLKRLKTDSNKFRKSLDSSLDRSRLDGTNREDDINTFVKDFEQETDRLHDRFKDHKSVAADVESVLSRAGRIDQFMVRHRLGGKAERDWAAVRANLNQLAEAYNVTWNW